MPTAKQLINRGWEVDSRKGSQRFPLLGEKYKCRDIRVFNNVKRGVSSCDSSVGIATVYGLVDPDSIPGRDKIFLFPQRPDRLWGPPSLLFNAYPRQFLQG
jgi:hypothetical protein